MPVFTAGAAAIATAIGFTAGSTGFIIAQSLIAAGLAAGTGHLLGVFDEPGVGNVEDPGVEQRLQANTQNKVPVLYGQFMQRGTLTFFEISADRQTLHSVITLGEGPVTSISKVYWDDILLTIDSDGQVTSGTDVDGETTTRLNGQVTVHLYPAGGPSTYLESLSTDWTSNHKMTGLAYAVVTVKYNRDNDVTGLADMRFIGAAPIKDPADAVMDQLTNARYGLGLPATSIDTASFTTAKAYFSQLVAYQDAAGDSVMAARFEVNGSVDTGQQVSQRIESILMGSNSSLRWQGGKYSIFINKADAAQNYTITEGNLVGNISVSEVGLNSVVNQIQVRYGRDAQNNYQRNTATVTLPTDNMYPNEQRRVRSIDLPLVRTFVEAERIAFILLNQSREQLTIKHITNVEAMALEAGDVIKYTLTNYGWEDKLFRITRINEIENEDGLQYEIEATEYADSVYAERTHIEPGSVPNVNLPKPSFIPPVSGLTLTGRFEAVADPYARISWAVPSNSLIEEFEIYINGTDTTFSSGTTRSVGVIRPATSGFTPGEAVTYDITGLPAGSYTIWVVGRNSFASSNPSNPLTIADWNPTVTAVDDDLILPRLHKSAIIVPLDADSNPIYTEAFSDFDVINSSGRVDLFIGAEADQPDETWRVVSSSGTTGVTVSVTDQNVTADTARLNVTAFTAQTGTAAVELSYKTTEGAAIPLTLEASISTASVGAQGEPGAPGATPTPFYSPNALTNKPTTTPPSNEWVSSTDLEEGTDYNWIIWGVGDGTGTPSIYTFTFTGVGGELAVTTPATPSSGTITVPTSASTGTGVVGQPETITMTVTGDTGSGGTTQRNATTADFQTEDTVVYLDFEIRDTPSVSRGASTSNTTPRLGVSTFSNFNFSGSDEEYGIYFDADTSISYPDFILNEDVADRRAKLIQLLDIFDGLVLTTTSTPEGNRIKNVFITDLGNGQYRYSATIGSSNAALKVELPDFAANQQYAEAVAGGVVLTSSAWQTGTMSTPSQIGVGLADPTDSFTITLEPELTTQADIAADIVAKFNSNADYLSIFQQATVNASSQVVFSTIEDGDITFSIGYIDNSGDITGSHTSVDGTTGSYTNATLRLNTPDDTPTMSDIILASGLDDTGILNAIRPDLITAGYTVTVADNVLTYTRLVNGPSQAISISVTPGDTTLATANFDIDHTDGTHAIVSGVDATATVTIGSSTSTLDIAGQNAVEMASTIKTHILTDGRFDVEDITTSSFKTTAKVATVVNLTITITDSTGNASVMRVVDQTGSAAAFTFAAIQQLRGSQGSFQLDVYRVSATQPIPPVGGTQSAAPANWSYDPAVPGANQILWQSFVTFNPAIDTAATNFGTRWSSAFPAGQSGINGLNTRIDFAYANNITGTSGFSTTNAALAFRGTDAVTWREGDTVPGQSTSPADYEWAQWTGNSGEDGDNGSNGQNSDLYFAYADTDDGTGSTFSTTYYENALYQGTDVVSWTLPDSKPTQSTSASSYEWTRIRGENGSQGAYQVNVYRVASATVAPAAPSGGMLNTAPDDWSFDTAVPGTGQLLYQSFVTFNPASDSSATNFGTRWSTPFPAGQAGVNGLNNRIDFAYATNADGSEGFSLTDATLEYRGTNVVSWRDGETVPTASTTNTDYVWAKFQSTDGTPGSNGQNADLYFAYANTEDGSGTTFSTTYFENALYQGTVAVTWTLPATKPTQPTANTAYEWTRIRGSDGMPGGNGSNGNTYRTIYLYQVSASAPTVPNQSAGYNTTTGAPTATGSWAVTPPATVTAGSTLWLASATLVQSESTGAYTNTAAWTRGVAGSYGSDGMPGGPGESGNNAPRFSTFRLYTTSLLTSQPSTPSATITWATGAVSSISSGWSLTPPTQSVTQTGSIWQSDLLFIDTTGAATTTDATGNTPIEGTTFTGVVSFVNGNFLTGGATITNIDGGNITTGTVSVDKLVIDNITLDSNDAGQLVVNHGAGLTVIGNQLGCQVDGETVVVDNNGNLVAIGGSPAEFPFSGAISSRTYTGTVNSFTVGVSGFIWRFDTNLLGLTGDQQITGIELAGLSTTLNISAAAPFNPAADADISYNMAYITSSSPTSISGTQQVFDGGLTTSINNPGAAISQSYNREINTGGLVFPAPASGRYLFLLINASMHFSSNTLALSVNIAAQSDAVMTIHTSGGSAQTFNLEDYFT